MTMPRKGYLVRTKANSFKVLCAECVRKLEHEEFVRPWNVPLNSRCVYCQGPVILNPEEPRPQKAEK